MSLSSDQLWSAAQEELRFQVSRPGYEAWLKNARLLTFDEDAARAIIGVPTPLARDWVSDRYSSVIRETLSAILNRDIEVDFTVQTGAGDGFVTDTINAQGPTVLADDRVDGIAEPVPGLNQRYTFNAFVDGNNSRFAYAACRAVADSPSRAYNPLFLYGGVGLGKTHLMHAVGHAVWQSHRLRVAYVTSESFMNQMITSIQENRMAQFRGRYRTVDVLLVDDIQFLAGKDRTQEEFFHTFNALYGAQKQIVLSSDRPPRELSQLEERLRSRFEVGLIADIQAPDLETKISILIQRAQMERLVHPNTPELTPEVAEFIAGAIKSNIRELEGALVRLLAYCALKGVPIGIPIAQEALRNVIDQQQRKLDIETIARAVAEHFGMRIADLKARNNSKNIVFPRQLGMFLAKQLTEASLGEIARFYGGKHHSTVIHSIRKIEQERQADRELDRTLNRLTEQLG